MVPPGFTAFAGLITTRGREARCDGRGLAGAERGAKEPHLALEPIPLGAELAQLIEEVTIVVIAGLAMWIH